MQPTTSSESTESLDAPALPEVVESAAEGLVADIYGDIRATLGVPLVNLVYRYLATRPGALAWAWRWLRPHFVSGAMAEQAHDVRAAAARQTAGWTVDLGPLPDAERMAALVAAYNQANALNLMALIHLLQLDEPEGEDVRPQRPSDQRVSEPLTPSSPQPLPPLPAWAVVPPVQHALVLRLNQFADGPRTQVVASLYRHLTVWPTVLAPLESELSRLDALGELLAARTETFRSAARIASAQPLRPRPDASAGVDADMLHCLRSFATVTLPKMVPIGLALHAACRRATFTTTADRA